MNRERALLICTRPTDYGTWRVREAESICSRNQTSARKRSGWRRRRWRFPAPHKRDGDAGRQQTWAPRGPIGHIGRRVERADEGMP
jgi:hypothetical protein